MIRIITAFIIACYCVAAYAADIHGFTNPFEYDMLICLDDEALSHVSYSVRDSDSAYRLLVSKKCADLSVNYMEYCNNHEGALDQCSKAALDRAKFIIEHARKARP